MSSCDIAAQSFQGLLEAYFRIKSQMVSKKEYLSGNEKSVPQVHHLSSLGKLTVPNGDSRDGYFCPTLTLMIYFI